MNFQRDKVFFDKNKEIITAMLPVFTQNGASSKRIKKSFWLFLYKEALKGKTTISRSSLLLDFIQNNLEDIEDEKRFRVVTELLKQPGNQVVIRACKRVIKEQLRGNPTAIKKNDLDTIIRKIFPLQRSIIEEFESIIEVHLFPILLKRNTSFITLQKTFTQLM